MNHIKVGRTADNDSFQNTEIIKLNNLSQMMFQSNIEIGDIVTMPIRERDDLASFWESGGRKSHAVASTGIIVTGPEDQLLDAILFNKMNRNPNGKQALLPLRSKYRVYVGKVSIRDNSLSPRIRIIRMVYNGPVEGLPKVVKPAPTSKVNSITKELIGRFTVDMIYTDYINIRGNAPMERLIHKLFIKNVMKPYFANGWSLTDLKIDNREMLVQECKRLLSEVKTTTVETKADTFIDLVEDNIVSMDHSKKLSSALQYINFNTKTMLMIPIAGLSMTNIGETIRNASVNTAFQINLDNMMDCYNNHILYKSKDLPLLEVSLEHNNKYVIQVGDREFCTIRAYCG